MNKHACFTCRLVGGWSVFVLMLLVAAPAMAQESGSESGRSQINVQTTFPLERSNAAMDSSGDPLTDDPTRSAGFLIGYDFALNKRFRVEADYAASRNSQRFNGPTGLDELQGDTNQLTVEMQWALYNRSSRFVPYALAGTGAVKFAPTDFTKTTVDGVRSQSKAAFVYGGGVDFRLSRVMGVRAEYRGLRTSSPNFGLDGLETTGRLNIVEPSVGLFFRF